MYVSQAIACDTYIGSFVIQEFQISPVCNPSNSERNLY